MPDSTLESMTLESMTLESTTSADGTTIGYLRRGSGPSLVITHGSIATSEQWLPATDHLARHFTCFVHDRRGRGRSGDTRDYDLSTEVSDIASIMAIAGPEAHLLGHSYGALCALAYARTTSVDGTLLLFEPPLAVDGPVAGAGLATYRDLITAGDLDAALEFALVNFVRVPREAIPLIRATPLWQGEPAAHPDLGARARTDRRAGRRPRPLLLDHRPHPPHRRHRDDPVPLHLGPHTRRPHPGSDNHRPPGPRPLRTPGRPVGIHHRRPRRH